MIEEMDYRDFFREFLQVLIGDTEEFIADINEGECSLEQIVEALEALNALFKFSYERTDSVLNKVSIKFQE